MAVVLRDLEHALTASRACLDAVEEIKAIAGEQAPYGDTDEGWIDDVFESVRQLLARIAAGQELLKPVALELAALSMGRSGPVRRWIVSASSAHELAVALAIALATHVLAIPMSISDRSARRLRDRLLERWPRMRQEVLSLPDLDLPGLHAELFREHAVARQTRLSAAAPAAPVLPSILNTLSERARRAWAQYKSAIEEAVELEGRPDQVIYNYLKNPPRGEAPELPPFLTWSRYLREARAALGLQKNKPRRGRTGRSIVSPESPG